MIKAFNNGKNGQLTAFKQSDENQNSKKNTIYVIVS